MEPGKNINSLLKSFKVNSGSGYGSKSGFSMPSLSMSGSFNTNKLVFLATLIVAILIILVLIHFLVTPIFKTKMGSGGIIPLPVQSEGSRYWIKDPTPLPLADTPLDNKMTDFTVSLDLLLEKPAAMANKYRIIAVRKTGDLVIDTTGSTIQQQIGEFNFVIYLDDTKNDLHAAVLNTKKSIKEVVVKNVPVREPFRLVLVVADAYFDVYINGRLAGSNTFTDGLNTSADKIIGPNNDSVKAKNLILFNRSLSPAEAKDIRPGLAEFTIANLSNSTTCPTSTVTEHFVPSYPK